MPGRNGSQDPERRKPTRFDRLERRVTRLELLSWGIGLGVGLQIVPAEVKAAGWASLRVVLGFLGL